MNIALDLDRTIDRMPEFWRAMLSLGTEHGVTFYLVTCRRGDAENREIVDAFLAEHGISIPKGRRFFTAGQPKRDYMAKLGITIHVWIDDDPACILFGK